MHTHGDPVEFEVSSSDATTAVPLLIRNPGEPGGRPLLSTERFILTSIVAYVATASLSITLFNDADASGAPSTGERMLGAGVGTLHAEYTTGMAGAMGVTPKVKAGAVGVITLTGTGVIINT